MTRRRAVAWTFVTIVVCVVALFDWNWLREPLNALISKRAHRRFSSSDLQVRLALTPTIRLANVSLANPSWAAGPTMATFGVLEFSVSIRDLLEGSVLLPRVAVTDGDMSFERRPDGRKNWTLNDSGDTSPSRLRISSLSVTRGHLRYSDAETRFKLDLAVTTSDPGAAARASTIGAAPMNRTYTTRYKFAGDYRSAAFQGEALTGDVLSFQESGIAFPIRGHLVAGTTQLDVEGKVADAARISSMDLRLIMAGETLANIYPFLQLPLPASPPYRLAGHLTQVGERYVLDQIDGQIGSSDVQGSGSWLRRPVKPLLEARVHSRLVRVADLGPLIGVQTSTSRGKPASTQADTQDRPTATAHQSATTGDHLLPAGTFEGSRLRAIDADIDVLADRLQAPDGLNVVNVRVTAKLADSVLQLDPITLGLADGEVKGRVVLDASRSTIHGSLTAEAQRLHLQAMLPRSSRVVSSRSLIGATARLEGSGNSIADMASHANGEVSAVMSGGKVSNLLDAAVGLNGGKVLKLMVGGDKDITLRCGAMSFDVKDGVGRSQVFVLDTEQTRVDGTGGFNLGHERFDALITPQPKHPGIFSMRTPFRVFGSFRHAGYELDRKALVVRGGSAVALALVAPIAALVPLIETGPGNDVDCARLTSGSALDSPRTAVRR